MKAAKDFLWYKGGQEISPSELPENVEHWKSSGLVEDDKETKVEPVINASDLNRDGKVDGTDISIAASVLKKSGSIIKRGR